MSTIRPDIIDRLYDLVRDSVDSGVSVVRFRSIAQEAWSHVLDEKRADDNKEWLRGAKEAGNE